LIAGLECLVALLRDKPKADRVDVKLYLADASKLQYKLKNIDPKELTMELVQKHKEDLATHARAMGSDENAEKYVVFAEWGQAFAVYAEDILDQFARAEEVVRLTKRKDWLDLRIKIQQRAAEIYQDKEVAAKLGKGIDDDKYARDMEAAADSAMEKTTGPAQAAQAELRDFGTNHFQGLIRGGAPAQV
jgi:hypothetical protein